MPRAATIALLLAVAGPARADVEITTAGDRLDVSASQAPVSDVLAGLARKTRMKVVYEGAVPRAPVTIELRGRTPAEAVLGVLDGLGLDYAMVMDASGTEVETLMIVGTGVRAAGAFSPARNDPAPPEPPEPPYEEPGEEERRSSEPAALDVPKKDEEVAPAPAPVGPLNPSTSFPVSPFAPGPPPTPAPAPAPSASPGPARE